LVVELPDASLRYTPAFLGPSQADHYLARLLADIAWREESVFVWGKWRQQPRLVAWHGDPEATYTYSGRTMTPLPWIPVLGELRSLLEDTLGARFNSVLLNLYRDGNDSMGWHSDDETELGDMPTIASLSLGATREFMLKHRTDETLGIQRLSLMHGSLLVMAGATQKHWKHAVGKSRAPCGQRVNLTFRFIHPTGQRRRR
jgi:alkylated DNA repair dioxygenase AlkB